MFKNTFFTYNLFLTKKLSPSTTVGAENFMFATMTSKIIKYNSRYQTPYYTFFKTYKNINWLSMTTIKKLDNTLISTGVGFTPLFLSSQSTLYHLIESTDRTSWVKLLFNNFFTIILYKLIQLYKLITLLHLPLIL